MPRSTLVGLLLTLLGGGAAAEPPIALQATLTQTVAREAPAFTQGLEIHRGRMLQSSGLYGRSYIESLALPGESASDRTWRLDLPDPVFAEGLTVVNDRLYLLSWRRGQWWQLDPATGERLASGHYEGEGWGLTHHNGELIRSDGSATLTFHAAGNFAVQRRLAVTEDGEPLDQINELESACGYLWANLWHSERIVAIDPATGAVRASADLSGLVAREAPTSREAVLNGIAWDARHNQWWLTGKRWRHWYRVRLDGPDGRPYCPSGHKKAASDTASDAARPGISE